MKTPFALTALLATVAVLASCSRPSARQDSTTKEEAAPAKQVAEAMISGESYQPEPNGESASPADSAVPPAQAMAQPAGASMIAYGGQRPANRLPKPPAARKTSVSVSSATLSEGAPQAVFSVSTGSGAQQTTRDLVMPPGAVEPVAFVPVTEDDGFTTADLAKLDSLVDQFVAEVAPETGGSVPPAGLSGGAPVSAPTPAPASPAGEDETPVTPSTAGPTPTAEKWMEAQRRSDALFRVWYGDDAYSEMAARRFFQSQAAN